MSPTPPRSARVDAASLALRGGVALAARQVVVHSANILGGIVLARILPVSDFGLWSIAAFAFNAWAAIASAGLGASLIRHPEAPAPRDERSVLAAQQILGLLLGILGASVLLVAGKLGAPTRDVFAAPTFLLLLLALLVSFFQTVPAARLERSLRFDRLALVEMSQALLYNLVIVGGAAGGASVRGVALALLARSVIGAVLAYRAAPWEIGWSLDLDRVRTHARFGLPFQGGVLLSTVKDSLTPVFVGLVAGTAAVGAITWAQMAAAFPVLGLMILQRLYLPLFARTRDAGQDLSPVVEIVIASANAVVAPLAVIALVLHRPLIEQVFGARWLMAVPLFLLLWPANLLVATVTPLLSLMNALGRARQALSYALLWAVGMWALAGPLVLWLGPTGYGWANLLIQFTNVPLIYQMRALVPFRVGASILPAWTAAGLMGGLLWGLSSWHSPVSLLALALYSGGGLIVYVTALITLFPERARAMRASVGQDPS